MGLHNSSFTGFYDLCRAVLIKSETEYDKFDQAFYEFFKDVPYREDLPEEFWNWVNKPAEDLNRSIEELKSMGFPVDETMLDIMKGLEERIKNQHEQHNGGRKWVGTQGYTAWGNSGWHPGGIRIGGNSMHRTAAIVAGERNYRDFRKDNTLDTRQFQMAFRLLRQLSANVDSNHKILDVDETVRKTGDNAGVLKIKLKNERKNAVKVLMFIDTGGSMDVYANMMSMLFQAATKSNTFKELHLFYFHNCIYDRVYKNPRMFPDDEVELDWVLKNYDRSYKTIIVGDAQMNPYELFQLRYDWKTRKTLESGMTYLQEIKKSFTNIVWLNPEKTPKHKDYWTQTHYDIAKEFKMYHLTVDGLEKSMKQLMSRTR